MKQARGLDNTAEDLRGLYINGSISITWSKHQVRMPSSFCCGFWLRSHAGWLMSVQLLPSEHCDENRQGRGGETRGKECEGAEGRSLVGHSAPAEVQGRFPSRRVKDSGLKYSRPGLVMRVNTRAPDPRELIQPRSSRARSLGTYLIHGFLIVRLAVMFMEYGARGLLGWLRVSFLRGLRGWRDKARPKRLSAESRAATRLRSSRFPFTVGHYHGCSSTFKRQIASRTGASGSLIFSFVFCQALHVDQYGQI